jgi:protein-disulfide isomerase
MFTALVRILSAALLALPFAGSPQERPGPAVVAKVKGETITLDELEKGAAGALNNLVVQRQRILEAELERLLAAKVVALEAKSRGETETDLVQEEVDSKVTPPSAEDIAAYYKANQDRIREPQDKVAPQIRQALFNQRRQKLYTDFVARLKTKYGATTFLEPVRFQVDDLSGPARGPASAVVKIVEFSDFQCPYCAALAKTLADVLRQYGDRVRLVFRQFPLERIHPDAVKAAEASLCASDQGRFWEMHDQLFRGGPLSEPDVVKKAAEAGLAMREFQACLSSGTASERVRADVNAGTALGISSTPSFFVNGRPMRGAVAYTDIVRIVEQELAAGAKRGR